MVILGPGPSGLRSTLTDAPLQRHQTAISLDHKPIRQARSVSEALVGCEGWTPSPPPLSAERWRNAEGRLLQNMQGWACGMPPLNF